MERKNETYEHEPTIAKLGKAIEIATADGNYEPAIDFIHDGTCRVCVNAMAEAVGVIVELEEQVRGLQAAEAVPRRVEVDEGASMRLTDEQLAKHDILAQARVWAGTKYEYPLIDALVSELLTARRVVAAVRKRVADWDSQVCDPRAACFQCQDPDDIAEMRKALAAHDAATKEKP